MNMLSSSNSNSNSNSKRLYQSRTLRSARAIAVQYDNDGELSPQETLLMVGGLLALAVSLVSFITL